MKKWLNSRAQNARGVNQSSLNLLGGFATRALGLFKRVWMQNLTPRLLPMYQYKNRPLCVSLVFSSCLIRYFSLAFLLAVLIFFPKVPFAAEIALLTSSNTVQGSAAHSSSDEAQTQINTLIAAAMEAYPGATQSGNTVQWEEGGSDVKRRMSRTWAVRAGSTQVTRIRATVTSTTPDYYTPVPGTRIYDSYVSQTDVLDKVVANAIPFYQGVGQHADVTFDTPHRGYGVIGALAYLQYYKGKRTCVASTVIACGVPLDMISVTTTVITPYYIDYKDTVSYCPAGYTLSGSTCSLPPDAPDPQKNNDEPDCGVGNPCNAGTGNKYQSEVDYAGSGVFPLKLERVYNSGSTTPSSVEPTVWGSRWRGVYDRSIAYASNGTISTATAKREGGKQYYFNLSGTSFVGDADVVGTLVRLGVDASGNATGWTYTNERDEVERYAASGELVRIANRSGQVQTLTYSDGTTGANGGYVLDATGAATATVLPAGRLIRVTDPAGGKLQYGYDVAGRVVKATDPAGGVYIFAYSDATSTANLTSVTYPDGKIRTYLYGEAANVSSTPNPGVSYANSLTGIVDENEVRYASWTYDAAGRATSSEHGALGSGIDHVGLDYGTADANGNSTTTVVDARGVSRIYGFSATVGVVKNTGITGLPCNGCASAVTYDANGNVASRTDFNGNKTCYAYDLARNLETARVEGIASGTACPTDVASYTPAAGTAERKILTQWHPTYRLPVSISEAGRQTAVVYDDHGNITSRSVTDIASGQTRISTTGYTYHPSVPGVLVQKVYDGPRTDVADLTTTDYYAPDASCAGGHLGCRGQVSRITNALGHVTQITRYTAHGQPEEIVDPNGLVTMLTYDPRQRLTQRNVGSEVTLYSYDFAGQLKQVTLPSGAVVRYDYDAAHRLTDIWDQDNNRIHYILDAIGNRIQEDTFDAAGTAVAIRNRTFDALNRLWQDIGAVNAATGVRPTITYAYDAAGNLTSVTPPGQPATSYQYDALNRLFASTDALGGVSQYRYDPLGRLTQVRDPRNVTTTYDVNAFGEQTRIASPDSGVTVRTYDPAGNLVSSVDARGKQSTYSYDALNRLTGISFTSGNPVSFSYDQGAGGIGRLTGMTDESGTTTWQYDQHGRVTQRTLLVGGVPRSIAYRYDNQGRLDQLTYPSGKLLGITWNVDKPQALTIDAQPVVSGIQYHPFGGPRQWTLGNTQTVTRVYDADNRLAAYTLGNSVRGLVFDDAGRIVRIDDSNPAYTQNLAYDNLDRVTGWNTALLSQAYTYDAGDNRTSAVFGGSASYSHSVAADSNRLQSVEGPLAKTYQHDAAGNIVDDSRTSFTYNDRGRMESATTSQGTTSYLVNGLGQRSVKTGIEGIRFVYDEAGRLIGEYDAGGTLLQETLYLGDIPVAVVR